MRSGNKNNSSSGVKNRMLNTKIPAEKYVELQEIAENLGMSLSAMVRHVIYTKLEKVHKTGSPKSFID